MDIQMTHHAVAGRPDLVMLSMTQRDYEKLLIVLGRASKVSVFDGPPPNTPPESKGVVAVPVGQETPCP